MKKVLSLILSSFFSINLCFSADCVAMRNSIYRSTFTPNNYEQNIQKVNNYYNSGCKDNVDKNYMLGQIAFYTSDKTNNKIQYLQNAYNYFVKSNSDNGFWAGQMALQFGEYYKNNSLYDNAIIWYKRAAENYIKAKGDSGFIPAYIADAYILKGNCSSATFKLYDEAIGNMVATYDNHLIREAQNKAYMAAEYCSKL